MPQDAESLFAAIAVDEIHRAGNQSIGQGGPRLAAFERVEGLLEQRAGGIDLAREDQDQREPREGLGPHDLVFARPLGGKEALEQRPGLVGPSGPQHHLGQRHRRRPAGRPPVLLEQIDRPAESLLGDLGGLLEIPLRLRPQRQRRRRPSRRGQRLERSRAKRGDVVGVRIGADPLLVMGREHLGDVAELTRPGPLEMARGGDVVGLARAARQHPVRDRAQQRLEEVVLASLGRARIIIAGEHLLGHEPIEDRLDLGLGPAAHRRCGGRGERLAEHGGILEQRALAGRKPVEPRGDERLQRLGHVEVRDVSGDHVPRAFLGEQATVLEHADRLDRVQRDALGAASDLGNQFPRQSGRQPLEHGRNRLGLERVEHQRLPRRPPLPQLRPGEREHHDWEVGRPLQQVVDEVEQPAIRPLQVLEHEHHRRVLREPLEEQAPAREQVRAVGIRALLEPQQVREPRLDQPALPLVGDEPLDRDVELLARHGRLILLGDLRPRPDHLGERPVRDTLAVGQRPPVVPVALLLDPVHVLEQLPDEPRLTRARLAEDHDVPRPALMGAVVAGVDDRSQLGVAPHERRLEPGAAARAAGAGHDPKRRPGVHGLLAALDLMRAASS